MQELTDTDKSDLIEGIKKRPEKKWKKAPKRTVSERLEDEVIESGGTNLGKIAKKYEKTTTELVELCNKLGIY